MPPAQAVVRYASTFRCCERKVSVTVSIRATNWLPCCALRAEAGAPPDHRRTQGALRRVVGRLDAVHAYKQPEGGLDFEQLATRARGPRPGRFLPASHRVRRTCCEPLLDGARISTTAAAKASRVTVPSRTRCHHETSGGLVRASPRRSAAMLHRVRRSCETRGSGAPSTTAAAQAATNHSPSTDP